jgi:hypothetical protein
MSERFRTKVLQSGKTATGIEVPAKVVEALGSSKRPAVSVTIKGYTYRSSIAVMDGTHMVGVSAKVREEARVAGGDTVDVEIELDTAPREVTVPPDLKKALDRDKGAKQTFEALSFSRKQRLVLPIGDAKTPETRLRRVDKAVAMLRDGKA